MEGDQVGERGIGSQSCGHRVSREGLVGFVQGTCRPERSREGGHSPVGRDSLDMNPGQRCEG